MFQSSHPNNIESDEGFSIQVLAGGQLGIIYREGNRAIKVLSETAIKPHGYIVYKNSIKEWAPPGSGQSFDNATQKRIIDNLRRAFAFQGYDIKVNDVEDFSDDLLKRLQKIE